MKTAVAAAAFAAVYTGKVSASVPVTDEQWPEVFEELQDCLAPMGFCSTIAPVADIYDTGVELGFKSKGSCLANSFHEWQETVNSPAALKQLTEAEGSDLDLFLLRRTAKLPVTGGLSKALESSIAQGSYQGYLRCKGREYVYMFGERQSVYNAVGDSFESVDTPFGSHALTGFDLAFPVPQMLRLSPYILVQLNSQVKPSVCYDKVKLTDKLINGNSVENAICPDSIPIKLILANGSVKHVDHARRLAAEIHRAVHTHGRSLFDAETNNQALASFSVKATSTNHIRLEGLPQSHMRSLLSISEVTGTNVVWAELAPPAEFSNYDAALVTQARTSRVRGDESYDESMERTPFWASGITGKNQIVGVGDSGLKTEHCFFQDPNVDTTNEKVRGSDYVYEGHRKLINYFAYADGLTDSDYESPAPSADHGTHVAGTVLGAAFEGSGADANTAGHHGIAPDAKLSFYDIGNDPYLEIPDDIYNDYLKVMYDHGARVQTNSWGVPFGNYYSDFSRLMDEFAFDHQDFVVLFAAGNSDYHMGSSGSLGSPGTQKNAVTVAASMNADAHWEELSRMLAPRYFECGNYSTSTPCESGLAFFSSNGPTFDGRIKPDIAAPGFFVVSSDSRTECSTTYMAGTSMACPAAAGNLALVRQYLEDGFYPSGEANAEDGFKPMGALVKAIAINSAQPMTGDYTRNGPGGELARTQVPNFEYGFGLIQLDRALPLAGHSAASQSVFLDGDFEDMPTVDNWGFVEYKFNAKVETEVKVTLVWHDPSASGAARTALVNDLDLEVVDANGVVYFPNNRNYRDELNNVEQTSLVVNGEFTVRVKGVIVPFGPQPYALVLSGNDVELVGKVTDGVLDYGDVVGDVSYAYYLAWVFGAVTIGGVAFLGASRYSAKRRGEANKSLSTETQGNDPFSSFMVKGDESEL